MIPEYHSYSSGWRLAEEDVVIISSTQQPNLIGTGGAHGMFRPDGSVTGCFLRRHNRKRTNPPPISTGFIRHTTLFQVSPALIRHVLTTNIALDMVTMVMFVVRKMNMMMEGMLCRSVLTRV